MTQCKVCDNRTGNQRFSATEKMFGLGGVFLYLECAKCSCIWIEDPPADIERYYPRAYYSLADSKRGRTASWMRRKRAAASLGARDIIGSALRLALGPDDLADSLKPIGLSLHASILDVGSGEGHTLVKLQELGFRDVLGIDPYVERSRQIGHSGRILRQGLMDTEGSFDFIHMSHTLEHLDDPVAALIKVAQLLKPSGRALVKVPVAGSYAWRTYGVNWVQLDAPRHFHINSEESFLMCAVRADMQVTDIVYDSTGFQFWASEQYESDIPLVDRGSQEYQGNIVFTPPELRRFERTARVLNEIGDGDQARFYLAKV